MKEFITSINDKIFNIDGQVFRPFYTNDKHNLSELKLFWIFMIEIWYQNWYKNVEHGSDILMT